MGIFGGSSNNDSPQQQVDLAAVNDRLARLESALASLQAMVSTQASALASLEGQVSTLTSGAVAAGGPVPYAGNPATAGAGALPTDGAWLEEVRELKRSGKLINAIKVYREHTGVGLKEAKDSVEGMP